jgi:hypothetical protein
MPPAALSERDDPRRHFLWQPQSSHFTRERRPESIRNNHARIAIAQRDADVHGNISLSFVTVGLDGFVVAEHLSFERTYELSILGRRDWDSLLAEIYKNDGQARACR